MGQGLYTLLGFGLLSPPWADDDDANDELVGRLMDLGLHVDYECTPGYLVIPIAVDDPWLQDYWKLPPLPDMLPHPLPRTARVLPINESGMSRSALFVPSELCLALWEKARALHAAAGLTLWEPIFIVLNDWD